MDHANEKLSHQLDDALKDISVRDGEIGSLQRHCKQLDDEIGRLRQALDNADQNIKQLHKVC